jgi:hypothetical protein
MGLLFEEGKGSDYGWFLPLYWRVTLLALTLIHSTGQNQNYAETGSQSARLSWCQVPSGIKDQIFITLWQLRVCSCGALSVSRRRVYRLKLLLVFTSTDLLSGPSPAGIMTISYSLRFETLLTRRVSYPYLQPLGAGWSGYTPRHWVPFYLPLTTRRFTVEVFEPAFTNPRARVRVRAALRLVVYRQKNRFGIKSLENHDQNIFVNENLLL